MVNYLPWFVEKIPDNSRFATFTFKRILTVVFIASFLTFPLQVLAEPQAAYIINNISVDETSKSAAIAQRLALKKGQELAYSRLLNRIVPVDRQSKIPSLQYSDLVQLVSGIDFIEQKSSPTRYLAKINVRFNQTAVRNYLRNANIRFAETKSKPLLVLPVLKANATLQLWDASNTWIKVWRNLPTSDGLINLVIPVGDTKDIVSISPEQAIEGNRKRIKDIAQRYGTSEVLLTVMEVKSEKGKIISEVISSRIGLQGEGQTLVQGSENDKKSSLSEVFFDAANSLRIELEESWKIANILNFNDQRQLLAEINIKDLESFIFLRKELEMVSLVQKTEIVRLSIQEALVRIKFFGSPEQLKLALAQKDILLNQGSVYWNLQKAYINE
tara:strand:+ start:4104 stop:5261 length:1158 start_codon:yes stop_codon:yes gene_type:complete